MAAIATSIFAILKILSGIPDAVDDIATLASTLRGGWRVRSRDIGQLQADSKRVKENLNKFGIIGHSISDYSELFRITTRSKNSIDLFRKFFFLQMNEASNQQTINLLKNEYLRIYQEGLEDLFNYFEETRYIDSIDMGRVTVLINQIREKLQRVGWHIDHGAYDNLDDILDEISHTLIRISAICTARINDITKALMDHYYE